MGRAGMEKIMEVPEDRNHGRLCMKKFEVTFTGKDYDYVTAPMILEYIQSSFPKALVAVKTVRNTGKKNKPKDK